jgi:DNA-binding XRE family transcriptional regulator
MTGNELLLMRRDANITQGELSERIGYSRQAIVKWERGIHEIPEKIVPALIAACTKHIPKPAGLTAQDKAAIEAYVKMRKQPGETGTHAAITKLWRDHGFTPSLAAQAAIIDLFPELKGQAQ